VHEIGSIGCRQWSYFKKMAFEVGFVRKNRLFSRFARVRGSRTAQIGRARSRENIEAVRFDYDGDCSSPSEAQPATDGTID
jgi:hypothetical protein